MLNTNIQWGPLRTIPMGLLVEFEVLLIDEPVMRRQCGGGSTENLQTEPGPFLLIREQESCWERLSKIRELGEGRELPEGHHQHEVLQRRGLGASCFQSKWFQDSGRVEARGRQWSCRRREAVGEDGCWAGEVWELKDRRRELWF